MAAVLENKAALGRWRSFRCSGVLLGNRVDNESDNFKTHSTDDSQR